MIKKILLVAALAPPVYGQVQYILKSHEGIKQIYVGGQPLLTGCGLYFIGSHTGDDLPDNIINCHSNGEKMMRPLNNTGNKYLAQQLHFLQDANNPNRMLFGGEVGPSQFNFATVSMPFDADKNIFTHYRSSLDPTKFYKYSDAAFFYNIENDPTRPVYVGTAYGATWGELVSPTYTLRFTVTGATRVTPLFFVNHPDTRNAEFSFGPVKLGEKVNIVGHVEASYTSDTVRAAIGVVPMQPAVQASYLGADAALSHNIGQKDGDGWSVNTLNRQNEYMTYGPYIAMPAGNHTATFSLHLDNTTYDNQAIATIEVFNASTNKVLAHRTLRRPEFGQPFTPRDFNLEFSSLGGALEYRVLWHGYSYMKLNRISVASR